jgi:hypothetical protein
MLRYIFLLKQGTLIVGAMLFALPRLAALVPSTAYYTEFTVSAPLTPSLLHELFAFVAELCGAVPGLPCGAMRNISAT